MSRFRLLFLFLALPTTLRAQPDYPSAHWTPAACVKYYSTGFGHSFCVIHDMEGYYWTSISYLNRCDMDTNGNYNVDASVYYLVNGIQNGPGEGNPSDPPAGDITQSVRESNYAWHVSCWNRYMFGTEHEGFVSNPAWYTEAMYQASAGLQRHLCTTYGIPMDRNHIIGHNEWQNATWTNWMAANWPQIDTTCNNHTDPGQYWNWSHFMQLITNGLPPLITTQPASLVVTQGLNARFSVLASGTGTLHYQWQFNLGAIPGATASTYTVQNVQLTNAGGYSVVVTNTGGPTASAVAFLSVLGPVTNSPGCVLAPAGLLNWWPADGNPNDIYGSLTGTPANGFSYSSGEQGLAFHFDGASSYVILGAPSVSPPWTVCLWVNRQNAPGASAGLLSDGTYSLKLEQYNGTRQVGITQLGVGDYNFGYTVPAGSWTHLAFVSTASQTLLYANGVLRGSLTNTVPLPRGYLGATYVSSGNRFVDYLLASVDEALCFNRALSSSEVSAIYASGSAGLCRAPEFTGIGTASPGQVRLNMRGQTGKTFTLYSSSDLRTWLGLSTISNPTGATQSIDSGAGGQKFYRLRQP
jgi:hypothetical protein